MILDPVTAGVGLLDKFIGKFVKDKDLAAKLQAEARSQEMQGEYGLLLGQIEINKIEAAHKSLFVAGWRPFIGWVCGLGLFYNVLLHPFLDIRYEMPPVDPSMLYPVLMGMLGMGGLRTYEKIKGTAREK